MFLSGAARVEKDAKTLRPKIDWLKIQGATENNLKSIDVKFPVGLLTVVCGMSGSGKSTIVQMINRFYDPNSGNIKPNVVWVPHPSKR